MKRKAAVFVLGLAAAVFLTGCGLLESDAERRNRLTQERNGWVAGLPKPAQPSLRVTKVETEEAGNCWHIAAASSSLAEVRVRFDPAEEENSHLQRGDAGVGQGSAEALVCPEQDGLYEVSATASRYHSPPEESGFAELGGTSTYASNHTTVLADVTKPQVEVAAVHPGEGGLIIEGMATDSTSGVSAMAVAGIRGYGSVTTAEGSFTLQLPWEVVKEDLPSGEFQVVARDGANLLAYSEAQQVVWPGTRVELRGPDGALIEWFPTRPTWANVLGIAPVHELWTYQEGALVLVEDTSLGWWALLTSPLWAPLVTLLLGSLLVVVRVAWRVVRILLGVLKRVEQEFLPLPAGSQRPGIAAPAANREQRALTIVPGSGIARFFDAMVEHRPELGQEVIAFAQQMEREER